MLANIKGKMIKNSYNIRANVYYAVDSYGNFTFFQQIITDLSSRQQKSHECTRVYIVGVESFLFKKTLFILFPSVTICRKGFLHFLIEKASFN